MAALPKRIIKETERLMAEPVPGISAIPHDDNLRYFDVKIHGPTQSPYEGGVFNLELFLPDDYPMTPPKIRFLTKIYHPNIDKLGRICLDVLKSNWSPALQIRTILLSIQALLGAPNPDDPLAPDVAKRWKEDEPAAIATAKEWTLEDAKEHCEVEGVIVPKVPEDRGYEIQILAKQYSVVKGLDRDTNLLFWPRSKGSLLLQQFSSPYHHSRPFLYLGQSTIT
ncbi:hypothetical protein V491_04065 [Pseudogymnoascus sp. VKM F-3775]|nr:hypothetical protein V491_04065 [Pseudogymnoascus sp. VKM F-3775]